MDKEYLQEAIDDGMSTYAIAEKFNQSQTNVRYWLRKFGLKTSPKRPERLTIDENKIVTNKICKLCKIKHPYARGNFCVSCGFTMRRTRLKIAAIIYKGGCCEECGWRGNVSGFDFHHLRDKSFSIGQKGMFSWETLKNEIDKCKLLCAICHRIEHSKANPRTADIIYTYKGDLDLGSIDDGYISDHNWYLMENSKKTKPSPK